MSHDPWWESEAAYVGAWLVGVALVIFTLLGSIALIVRANGPSLNELCVSSGGEWSDVYDSTDKDGPVQTKKCEVTR